MRISSGILHSELVKTYDVEAFGDMSYTLSIENAMFLRADRPPDPGRVWIADKDARHTAEVLAQGLKEGTLTTSADAAGIAAGVADSSFDAGRGADPGGARMDGAEAERSEDSGNAAADSDEADAEEKDEGKAHTVAVTKDPEAAGPLSEIFETVFFIRSKASTSRIHSAIQDIFAKYDYWDAELHRVLTSSSDIQALIDVGTRIFDNPLLLHDVNFKTVAAAAEYSNEPALMPLLDDGKLPFLMQSEKNSAVLGTVSGNVMYLRANGILGISVNLFRRGKFKYRLMLLGLTREIGPHESALLEHLSDYIRLALGLVTGGSSVALNMTGFMANVFSGEINSHDYIKEQLAGFGWKAGDEYVIYRVYTTLHEKNDRTLGFMTTRIADLFDEQCVFEHDDSIVAMFNLTARGGGDMPIDIVMADFLRDNNLTAGKSDVFTGFEYILQYYAQADIANRLRPKVKQYDHLCRFRDAVRQHLIESCTERLPAFMVCAPELLRLKAYDEEHQTEFYRTLSIFLRNDMHSVKAAKDLFVARSTFIYRLDRIQAITGLDLNKLSDRWYLLLSLELIEQMDRQEVKGNA